MDIEISVISNDMVRIFRSRQDLCAKLFAGSGRGKSAGNQVVVRFRLWKYDTGGTETDSGGVIIGGTVSRSMKMVYGIAGDNICGGDTTPGDNPKTGDSSGFVPGTALLFVGGGVFAGVTAVRKKESVIRPALCGCLVSVHSSGA